jgi:DNA replication regulator DPB11
MNLATGFSRRSTHLLCPSGVGVKFEKAQEWGNPVVALGWLEEAARTGRIPAVEAYLVQPSGGKAGEAAMKMDVDMDFYGIAVGEMNGKGKGKEKAVDKGKAKEVQDAVRSMVNGVEGTFIMLSQPIYSI